MRYGTSYALADFCDRLVPAREPVNRELLKQTFDGMRRLAKLQDDNPLVTIHATLTAGLWITYRGIPYSLINPAKNFLRVGAAYGNTQAANEMEKHFSPMMENGEIEEMDSEYLKQWRFPAAALPKLWVFFEQFEGPSERDLATGNAQGCHSRYFPGEARQMALHQFIAEGRQCRGVDSKSKPHKLGEFDQIEFDHILPFALGGPSTYQNLQILCVACNRLKRATAS